MQNNEILPTGDLASATTRGRAYPYNRILVADDDADVRQVSAEMLRRFGYRTETASDGAAAWEALEANSYDLLITDNNLRKVSGVELIKKARSAHMTLPVILASAALPAEEPALRWLQSVATLIKPFSSGYLLETCYWRICVRCKRLLKPFSASVLMDTVEEVLAQPTASTDHTGTHLPVKAGLSTRLASHGQALPRTSCSPRESTRPTRLPPESSFPAGPARPVPSPCGFQWAAYERNTPRLTPS